MKKNIDKISYQIPIRYSSLIESWLRDFQFSYLRSVQFYKHKNNIESTSVKSQYSIWFRSGTRRYIRKYLIQPWPYFCLGNTIFFIFSYADFNHLLGLAVSGFSSQSRLPVGSLSLALLSVLCILWYVGGCLMVVPGVPGVVISLEPIDLGNPTNVSPLDGISPRINLHIIYKLITKITFIVS